MKNKYSKGSKIIIATEKAYNILYKKQGYKPYEKPVKPVEKVEKIDKELKEKEETIEE